MNTIPQANLRQAHTLVNTFFTILFVFLTLINPVFASITDVTLSEEESNEILFHIHAYYVEDLPISELSQNSLATLFEHLDPYSRYLDEGDLDAIFSTASGQYTGLGIEVEERESTLVITNTLSNSPASRAGLQKGDVLLFVNGQKVADKPLKYVSDMLRSAKKSTINLIVSRSQTNMEFALQREEISLDTVTSQLLPRGIGYVSIASFNNHTYHDVANHIKKLKSKYRRTLRGLILDLRDNPGGTLNSAVAISDLFLDSGLIVTTKGRFFDANQIYQAQRGDLLRGAPIAVLINENSASAAEILAGALQDNHRALIMGERSFGKGSVQSLIPLGEGKTALKLTTAKYFTPSGRSIDGIGIKPDVEMNKEVLSQLSKAVIMDRNNNQIKPEITNLLAKLDSHLLAEK
ncbi:S41 family peptidase [Pseudoalteromonas xiamenensis]|uniref:S41 family peptidase n=1 Tax=Pseudoalteromonas xiamenensis TaxID=882626 RepID=UPI0035E66D52